MISQTSCATIDGNISEEDKLGLKSAEVSGAKGQQVLRKVFGQSDFGADRILSIDFGAFELVVKCVMTKSTYEFTESCERMYNNSKRILGGGLIDVQLKTATQVSETEGDWQSTENASV